MAGILNCNTDIQNVCCDNALQYFKDRKSVELSLRRIVRLKFSDKQCLSLGIDIREAYANLDRTLQIPLSMLDSIGFKYECDELCPFPECLENLHKSEYELIQNWPKIESICTWLGLGMPLTKVAAWHSIDIGDAKRWEGKRKKVMDKADIYSQFQNFLAYL